MNRHLHPHLEAIGQGLRRSLHENVVENERLGAAFDELVEALEAPRQSVTVAPDSSS